MKIITQQIEIFKFNELDEKTKNKVLDNLRDINIHDDFWYEHVLDRYTEILEALGFYEVKINFSGFCSQGDGASFTAKFRHPKNSEDMRQIEKKLKNILSLGPTYQVFKNFILAPLTKNEIDENGEIFEVYRSGRYYHEFSIGCDCPNVLEVAREISKMIYRELNELHDELTSNEAVIEAIGSNEYYFTKNGKIF